MTSVTWPLSNTDAHPFCTLAICSDVSGRATSDGTQETDRKAGFCVGLFQALDQWKRVEKSGGRQAESATSGIDLDPPARFFDRPQ